jgi:hypothetical protein
MVTELSKGKESAHIAPGCEGLFALVRATPDTLRYENQLISAEATMSSRTAVSLEWEDPPPGSSPTLSGSKMASLKSIGMFCKTKRLRENSSAGFPCLARVSLHNNSIPTFC